MYKYVYFVKITK